MVQKYPSCLARIADGRVLQRRGGAGEQRRAGGVPGRRVKEMGGVGGAVGGAGGGGVGGSGGVGGVDSRVVVGRSLEDGSLGEVGGSCDGLD